MAVDEKKFTKRWLISLAESPPTKRIELKDADNKFLRARVSPTGKVSLSVYKCPRGDRKAVRVSLGISVNESMPDAAEIRRRANLIISQLDDGINPNNRDESEIITLQNALDEYLRHAQIKSTTVLGYRQRIEKHFSAWLDKPLVKLISAEQLLRDHRRIGVNSPIAANNALQALRRIINYTRAIHSNLPEWPTAALKKLGVWSVQRPRERKLHPREFPDFWQALQGLEDEKRDYFLFLLLTGCRRREALNLRNRDIDRRRRELTFRATKNGEDHTLPYTSTLESLIERRKSLVGSDDDQTIFTLHEPKSITRHIQRKTGLQISPHDLRRTFAAVGNMVVSTAILKTLLNHKSGKDVTDDYIGDIDAETLRDALQRIEEKMMILAGISNVVKLEVA